MCACVHMLACTRGREGQVRRDRESHADSGAGWLRDLRRERALRKQSTVAVAVPRQREKFAVRARLNFARCHLSRTRAATAVRVLIRSANLGSIEA